MKEIDRVIDSIAVVDRSLAPAIQAHLDDLTKPQGSLGRLEDLAKRYCLATGTLTPSIGKKKIFCFAGDHGVADEGVSAFPSEVTPQMVMNMLAGGAAINALTRNAGIDLEVVDIGVADPLEGARGLCRRKVGSGTDNIATGPAMSVESAVKAVRVGIELAEQAAKDGVTLIGTGEMGIANTTPASALLSVLLPCEVEDITGRGTGIDDDALTHKIEIIGKALQVNKDRLNGPLETLAAIGGFEIAGICGLILGAASCRIPVVVDGFISSAGALVACRMCESVSDYLFFSHLSQERGHKAFVEKFDVEPIMDMRMRLGEGTGAALAMSIIEASIKVYNEMSTFSGAGVSGRE